MVCEHRIEGFSGNGYDEISCIVVFKDDVFGFRNEKKYSATVEQLSNMTLLQIKDYIIKKINEEKIKIDTYNSTLEKLQNALA